MENKKSKIILIKILSLVTFVATLVSNALANILPINGLLTKEVSDIYGNLFAPAPITFAIWGVIYTLLFIFTVYILIPSKKNGDKKEEVISKIGPAYIISNIANALWIVAWHYLNIPLSLVLMLVLFSSLAYIFTRTAKIELSIKERFFVVIPFSIYFGWITVATIANITALLVYFKFDGFGIGPDVWTVIITFIGLIIGSITAIKSKCFAYGLVIVWAYYGIYLIHTSEQGWNYKYPLVVNTILPFTLIMLASVVYTMYLRYKQLKETGR